MAYTQKFHPVLLPAGRFVIVETIYNEGAELRFQNTILAVYAHRETGFDGAQSIDFEGATYHSMHEPVTTYAGLRYDDIQEMDRLSTENRKRAAVVCRAILNAAFPGTADREHHVDGRFIAPMSREAVVALLSPFGVSDPHGCRSGEEL